jgi:hypothetical protein
MGMIGSMLALSCSRLFAGVCLAAVAAMAQTPPAAPGFVGSDVCKTCHVDIWSAFYKNPHYQSLAAGDRPPDKTGCESCHGPAQEHVAARGGKTTIGRAFSLMKPEQILNTCLGCHAADFQKLNIRHSEHTLAGVVCTNCHSIHHSPQREVSATEDAQRDLFRLSCERARAVRYARQTPRERGRHGLLGLSQPAWDFCSYLAHGIAAAYGGPDGVQR